MSAILPHLIIIIIILFARTWCGLSANVRCRSETCCTRFAENTGRKKCQKSPSGHHRTSFSAISLQLRHVSTTGKKLLSSNISSKCPHNMVNFSLLADEIVSLVWGTPANFNGFRVLASLLQRRRSTEANQILHNVWPLPGLLDYIYIYTFSTAVAP